MPKHKTKVCATCGAEKSVRAFYKVRKRRSSYCIKCEREAVKKRMNKRYKTLNGKLYTKYIDATKAARQHGVKSTLTLDEVKLAYKYATETGCPYCGEAITEEDFSLDHIIPMSHGGENVQYNVLICHHGCNSRKNNNPFAECVEPNVLDEWQLRTWALLDRPSEPEVLRRILTTGKYEELER